MRNSLDNVIKIGLVGLFVLLLSGCSSEQAAVNPGIWTSQPDAIILNYTSSENINTSGNDAHTLLLLIIQTFDLKNMENDLQDSQGLRLLLSKTNDPTQVQNYYVTKIFVNPDESREVKITRIAGMQHIIVLASYRQLEPAQVAKIFNIPVKRKLFWGAHYVAPIQINLTLGEQGIVKATYTKK